MTEYCKAATYTEKTKAEKMYVILKLEMFTEARSQGQGHKI